jgi:4'-phosphopantetheinyl transferase EntD
MFTGPQFRGVASMDSVGDDGATATLRVLRRDGLFAGRPRGDLLLDPGLLDAAGQVVGFWTAEQLAEGFVIFPTGLAKLELFGPAPAVDARVLCRAAIRLPDDDRVESDLDLRDEDGRTLARLRGWEDRRFRISREFAAFVLAPGERPIAVPRRDLAELLFRAPVEVRWLDGGAIESRGTDADLWQRVLAHLVLARGERNVWRTLSGPPRRRREWLLGRLAAKEAVRALVASDDGMPLLPADVVVEPDPLGRPTAGGGWRRPGVGAPHLSIAHAQSAAVGVAARESDCRGVGVDVERVGDRAGFESAAFDEGERALLDAAADDGWALRCWCAKAAAAKALGPGMEGGPRTLRLQAIDVPSGGVRLRLAGALAQRFPELAQTDLTAHTAVVDGWVFGGSLLTQG